MSKERHSGTKDRQLDCFSTFFSMILTKHQTSVLLALRGNPYWGCAAPKGHFLSPDSLANQWCILGKNSSGEGIFFFSEVLSQACIFFGKPLTIGLYELNLRLFLENFPGDPLVTGGFPAGETEASCGKRFRAVMVMPSCASDIDKLSVMNLLGCQ